MSFQKCPSIVLTRQGENDRLWLCVTVTHATQNKNGQISMLCCSEEFINTWLETALRLAKSYNSVTPQQHFDFLCLCCSKNSGFEVTLPQEWNILTTSMEGLALHSVWLCKPTSLVSKQGHFSVTYLIVAGKKVRFNDKIALIFYFHLQTLAELNLLPPFSLTSWKTKWLIVFHITMLMVIIVVLFFFLPKIPGFCLHLYRL